MRVGQRWDHRAAAQIQRLRAPADRRLNLALTASGDHATIADADRLDTRHGRVERVDWAIIEEDGCHGCVLSASSAKLWYAPTAILSMPSDLSYYRHHCLRLHRHTIGRGHAQAQRVVAWRQAIGSPDAEDAIGDRAIAARELLPAAGVAPAAPFERVGAARAPTYQHEGIGDHDSRCWPGDQRNTGIGLALWRWAVCRRRLGDAGAGGPIAKRSWVNRKGLIESLPRRGVRCRQTCAVAGDLECLAHNIARFRLSAGDEALLHLIRAGVAGQRASVGADRGAADAGRALELLDRPALLETIHDRAPDCARAVDTGDLLHRRVVAIANPDADGDIGRVADRPRVVPFIAGAGLDGGRPAIRQLNHIAGAEHILARHIVAHDIGEQVGDLLAVLAQRRPPRRGPGALQ